MAQHEMTAVRRATRPRRPDPWAPARTGRSRGPGSVHAIVGSMLAVLALGGAVTAILLLATQPAAARLEREVTSLTGRLHATQTELATLRSAVVDSVSRHAVLTRDMTHLTRRVGGLQRTVHGLQSAATLTREEARGLRVCVPQLQQELAGLTLRTRTVNGRVRSVGLSDPTLLSPACQAVFSGL